MIVKIIKRGKSVSFSVTLDVISKNFFFLTSVVLLSQKKVMWRFFLLLDGIWSDCLGLSLIILWTAREQDTV